MEFFHSLKIQFLFQNVLHSACCALTVEILLRIWKENRPEITEHFRTMVLILPVLAFPFYQWLMPQRGDFFFRQQWAWFDSIPWLTLQLGMGIEFWHVLLLFFAFVSVLFVVQELYPAFRTNLPLPPPPKIGKEKVEIVPFESTEMLIFTRGFFRPVIYVSTRMIELLDEEQLKAVLTHEQAHIRRRDNITGLLILLFRTIQFFNPIALIEFRRLMQDREKACDEMAYRITQKPYTLASSLIKILRTDRLLHVRPVRSFYSLELHSHRMRIEERILNIVHPASGPSPPLPWARWCILLFSLSVLLFFVV